MRVSPGAAPWRAPYTSRPIVELGTRYILRPAYIGDAYTVLQDLREEDRIEWAASVRGGAEDNLWTSIQESAECWTVAGANDDIAHIIFGVYPTAETPSGLATTWLLGTNQGQQDCGWILQECREHYTAFFKRWPKTVCYSDPSNHVHHRWLGWMGYHEVAHVKWGAYGAEFIEFRKEE